MTAVDVLIPWWDHGPVERDRPRDWVLGNWQQAPPGYRISFACYSGDEWCKAKAVAAQLGRTSSPVVVVADADVWCSGVHRAVQQVARGIPWAIPHLLVHRLDRASTLRLLSSSLLHFSLEREPYEGIRGGGIVVLDRGLALDVPIDERFVGWGGEDHAWGYALTTIGGEPWRGTADLWHLWHPHAAPDRPPTLGGSGHIGSMRSEYLRRRYFDAQNDQAATRRLLDEGRGSWPSAG